MNNQARIQKIGFIGGGNMASAIIQGLVKKYPADHLYVADHNQPKLDHLHASLAVNTHKDYKTFISSVDVLVLAIKPQGFPELLPELHTLLSPKQLLISIASGVSIKTITKGINHKSPAIIRAMPNIPATIQLGATALFANASVNDEQKNIANTIFNACGLTTWLTDESLISAVVAAAGSSPAYFFYMIEIMIEKSVKLGLSHENAALLVAQAMLGSAQLCLTSALSPDALKRSVMSPQGTTERAITSLEKDHFSTIIDKAMDAAYKRDQELSLLISEKIG